MTKFDEPRNSYRNSDDGRFKQNANDISMANLHEQSLLAASHSMGLVVNYDSNKLEPGETKETKHSLR